MVTPRRYSIAGTRAKAEADDLVCSVCRADLAPALVLLEHQMGRELQVVHRLCLPCIARAVESATGWKVVRAWAQWLASSKLGQTLKGAEDAFNAPREVTQ